MKKVLTLTLCATVLLCLSACQINLFGGSSKDSPAPLSIEDMYIYDSDGNRTDLSSIADKLDTEHSTFRGVKPGDHVSVLADKYILSDFQVMDLFADDPSQVGDKDNILWEGTLDIKGRLDIDDTSYFLSFTVDDHKIFTIFVNAIT